MSLGHLSKITVTAFISWTHCHPVQFINDAAFSVHTGNCLEFCWTCSGFPFTRAGREKNLQIMKAKHLAHSANTCILMMGGEVINLISSFHPSRVRGVRRWGAQKPLFTPPPDCWIGIWRMDLHCHCSLGWHSHKEKHIFQGLYVVFIYIFIWSERKNKTRSKAHWRQSLHRDTEGNL